MSPPSARDAALRPRRGLRGRGASSPGCGGRPATRPSGVKVGFANKAVWRVLKLDTLVWAHMYDDTVRVRDRQRCARCRSARMISPKIEPEIVFKLKAPLGAGVDRCRRPCSRRVEWLALGFEIIDCVVPRLEVPARRLRRRLRTARRADRRRAARGRRLATIAELVEQLPKFKVRLAKDGQLVEEGSGSNSLRSPALCLVELASAMARQAGAEPLAAGDLVSSGTLTESHRSSRARRGPRRSRASRFRR